MKTKILSIAALLIIFSSISKISNAATAKNDDYVVLNDTRAINKIEVHGNVELFISNNPAGKVEVFNKYYSESALVQNRNGVLRISSYDNEKLIVWVAAADLRSVSAYDNAEVKSFGELSDIEFSIDLHDHASAKLNLNAYSADVTLRDHSRIELSGTATEFDLSRNADSSMTGLGFSAAHFADNIITAPIVVAKSDDLAGLE